MADGRHCHILNNTSRPRTRARFASDVYRFLHARSQLLTVICIVYVDCFPDTAHCRAGLGGYVLFVYAGRLFLLEFGVPNFELFNVGEQLAFREPGLLRVGAFSLGWLFTRLRLLWFTWAARCGPSIEERFEGGMVVYQESLAQSLKALRARLAQGVLFAISFFHIWFYPALGAAGCAH